MIDARSNVAALAKRADHDALLRTGAIDTLTRKAAAPRAQAEPANRRVKLSLTATQEAALKEKAGDVPLARWVVRCLERQGVIPLVARGRNSR
jgi:hypothetical protein